MFLFCVYFADSNRLLQRRHSRIFFYKAVWQWNNWQPVTVTSHNTSNNGAVKSDAINLKQVSPKVSVFFFFFLAQLFLSPGVAWSTSLIANC